eukprot:gene12301-5884_t
MVAIIKIKVVSARNLPIMDLSQDTTDAYVEINFGDKYFASTNIVHKSLSPTWNHSSRFEIQDISYFQDSVIEISVWDHDVFTSDQIIGFVFIDPNILTGEVSTLQGWLPILDSFQGIRGELYVVVKVEWMDDLNPFKDSSASVHFASIPSECILPPSFYFTSIKMVEEVLIDEDPEYNWRDNFRSSTKSNNERQTTLYEMSGRMRRQIGKKTEENHGNAIFGYQEHFDLEEDNIVVRGLGTVCLMDNDRPNLSIVTKGDEELGSSPISIDVNSKKAILSKLGNEIILSTLLEFDSKRIKRIGSVVTARSVKLLEDEKNTIALTKLKDKWWNELREEIKNHAKTLECTHVIGYRESCSFQKDLCILSAVGTAAIIVEKTEKTTKDCRMCHVPYNTKDSPFTMDLKKCRSCKKKEVPEVIISTIEIPKELQFSKVMSLESRIMRSKKNKNGELNATQVSDILPFMENDLNKQLLYKMKIYGLNGAFNLKYDISVGNLFIVATASVTACLLAPLPTPHPLNFSRTLEVIDEEDHEMVKTQQTIQSLSEFHKNLNSPSSPSTLDEEYGDDSSDEAYIVEIDDDTDEDNMATLLDKIAPEGISFFNCHSDVLKNTTSNLQNIILKKIFTIKSSDKLNQTISSFYHDIYSSLCFSMNLFSPCTLNGIHTETSFKGDNLLEISISGMSLVTSDSEPSDESEDEEKLKSLNIPQLLPSDLPTPSPRIKKTPELMFELDGIELPNKDDFGFVTKHEEDMNWMNQSHME